MLLALELISAVAVNAPPSRRSTMGATESGPSRTGAGEGRKDLIFGLTGQANRDYKSDLKRTVGAWKSLNYFTNRIN